MFKCRSCEEVFSYAEKEQVCVPCKVRAAEKKAARKARFESGGKLRAIRWIGAYSDSRNLESRIERELETRDRQVACEVTRNPAVSELRDKSYVAIEFRLQDVLRTYSGDSWTVSVGRHLRATRSNWKAIPEQGLAQAQMDGHGYAEATLSVNRVAIAVICNSTRPEFVERCKQIAVRHNLKFQQI